MILTLFIFIIFSYLLPILYPICFFLSIYFLILCFFTEKSKKVRLKLYLAGFLIIIRIAGFLTGCYIAKYSEPVPKNLDEVYCKMGIMAFAAMPDTGVYEGILRMKRIQMQKKVRNIAENNHIPESFDLETKTSGTVKGHFDLYNEDKDLKWIKKNEKLYIYSIGPDRINTQAEIIYDPTNGISSSGDIIARRNLTNISTRKRHKPLTP